MVKRRQISKDKYIIAAILTFLIFFLGLSLGVIIDNYRLEYVEFESKRQEMDFTSLQFMLGYLSNLQSSNETCAALRVAFEGSVDRLAESMDEFLEFKEATRLNQDQYQLASRRYLLDNLRYWYFAEQTNNKCSHDLVTILYFYSGEHCDECPNQGVILTYFKTLYGDDVLIFPIDIDLAEDEPLIEVIKARYQVTDYPSIVVGDKSYSGVVPKEKVSQIICDSFEDKSKCKG